MPRKKTKFENFFSFTRHQRRWGGRKHSELPDDLEGLKTILVETDARPAEMGQIKSLDKHVENLRIQFSGKPELLFHHAKLIVLVRREFDTKENYKRFRGLWDQESAFLRKQSDLRWLISAADTFADHDEDPLTRSIAMMTSLLVNTIKVCETDRFIRGCETAPVIGERIERINNGHRALFDGITFINVGIDDTLRNMRWRLESYFRHGPAGEIAAEVFARLQEHDTAYGRLRALHHRERNNWWD
ncbi:hypothetical protein REJC140_00392 [Pseudorhizobium endolithicum]|uniref:HEPN AbiU2-like domain-containing protein n=1 Tax=Pseudorhizobium endolithicum TaxID=1191678 RepID=A0ABM8PE29_9HYPH|nr:hypothetical protein [Pseudorhizobium endolithicum]CAD6410631.1 class I SAM-dependent methyltransferase [Rhizobium sp. Q54]CAD7023981.1 hypothetical protein REJC140_00392 [Pseudorhizobium endolithicum]